MTIVERINANKADGAIKMGLSVFTSGMKPVFDGGAALNEGDVLILIVVEDGLVLILKILLVRVKKS